MTRVWQVADYDDGKIAFYWFATKKEAVAHIKETNTKSGQISPTNFPISKKGIVDALNWVITLTCFNEG